MRQPPFRSPLLRFVLAFFSALTSISAQTTTTPVAHLDQLDSTYNSNVRKYHGPILQDYLRDLNLLKQSLTAKSRNQDAAAVQTEIDRIKKISSTSGIFPYDPPRAVASENTVEDSPNKKVNSAIVLYAGNENRSSPDLDSPKEKPKGKALPVGAAEWRVEKIAPGNYRVAMLYSCADIPNGADITAKIGGVSIRRKLTSDDSTGGINEFRFTKLGVLTVDQELSRELLLLQNSEPNSAAIWVRQIILTKVKTPENK